MKWALVATHFPFRLPDFPPDFKTFSLPTSNLLRSKGKWLYGVTLAPWKSDCLQVWDATCPDALTLSYRAHATKEPGKVAAAEERKSVKYRGLPHGHMLLPLAIETLGAVGPMSLALLKKLGCHIRAELGEPKSTKYRCTCSSDYQCQLSRGAVHLYWVEHS